MTEGEREAHLIAHGGNAGAYFNREDGGIRIDAAEDMAGDHGRTPLAMYFHESGHAIDWLNGRGSRQYSASYDGGCSTAGWSYLSAYEHYWDDPDRLPFEAFAHFYSGVAVDGASLGLLERYLPRSKAIFDDMLSAMKEAVSDD